MRVCYFGTYDGDYVRNAVVRAALRSQGVGVIECHATVWNSTEEKVADARKGPVNPRLWAKLLRAHLQLVRRHLKTARYDAMVVGYPGHLDLFLARILTWVRRKPLVFDAYVSLYDTIILDRALARPRSLLGLMSRWLDRTTCVLADAVLLDTEANIDFVSTEYRLPRDKFHRIWVGADEAYLSAESTEGQTSPFRVLYFGKFIPLHGIDSMIRAAKLLEAEPGIRFEMIGGGQERPRAQVLAEELGLSNIDWGPEWLQPEALRERIRAAGVCLGIHGASAKAGRVIPTKAYIALAMGKPLLTRDSEAARELLVPGLHAMLCAAGDPVDIARGIAVLRRDPALRHSLAREGQKLFRTRCATEVIGQSLVLVLQAVCPSRRQHPPVVSETTPAC